MGLAYQSEVSTHNLDRVHVRPLFLSPAYYSATRRRLNAGEDGHAISVALHASTFACLPLEHNSCAWHRAGSLVHARTCRHRPGSNLCMRDTRLFVEAIEYKTCQSRSTVEIASPMWSRSRHRRPPDRPSIGFPDVAYLCIKSLPHQNHQPHHHNPMNGISTPRAELVSRAIGPRVGQINAL